MVKKSPKFWAPRLCASALRAPTLRAPTLWAPTLGALTFSRSGPPTLLGLHPSGGGTRGAPLFLGLGPNVPHFISFVLICSAFCALFLLIHFSKISLFFSIVKKRFSNYFSSWGGGRGQTQTPNQFPVWGERVTCLGFGVWGRGGGGGGTANPKPNPPPPSKRCRRQHAISQTPRHTTKKHNRPVLVWYGVENYRILRYVCDVGDVWSGTCSVLCAAGLVCFCFCGLSLFCDLRFDKL